MELQEFVDRAMDVPFLEKGRSWDGWDCWGLIYVAYKEVFGIELPLYTGQYQSTRRREELQGLISTSKAVGWQKRDPYAPGDVAVVRAMGRDCHVGLMLPDMHMLHVQQRVSAIVEPINCAPWVTANYNKVEGIYRYVL